MSRILALLICLFLVSAQDEVKAMLDKRAPADSKETIRRTLERMRQRVEFTDRVQPQIATWLRAASEK